MDVGGGLGARAFPLSSCEHQSSIQLLWSHVELPLLLVVDASSCRVDLPHLGYCKVEAAESLVSVSPVPLGILERCHSGPL